MNNKNMDFNNYDDKELIYLIKDGTNPKAIEIFLTKYNILALKIIRAYSIPGYLEEDLLSEASEILMKCIYRYSNEGSFYTYYSICLKRHLIRLKEESRNILNMAFKNLEEEIPDTKITEQMLYERKQAVAVIKQCNSFQKQIIALLKTNFSVLEIAKELHVSRSKVYYEIRRIKDLEHEMEKIEKNTV